MGSGYAVYKNPDVTPIGDTEPTFSPQLGFPEGRKERVMIATEEEMRACRILPDKRDYCAHLFLKIEQCRLEKFPWVVRCGAEKHAWENCQYDDYVLRMKEYERERRLLERKKRKEQAAAA